MRQRGRKGRFLVLKTLEAAGGPIAAFHQARSEYGRFDVQHRLHERPLRHVPSLLRSHRLTVHVRRRHLLTLPDGGTAHHILEFSRMLTEKKRHVARFYEAELPFEYRAQAIL